MKNPPTITCLEFWEREKYLPSFPVWYCFCCVLMFIECQPILLLGFERFDCLLYPEVWNDRSLLDLPAFSAAHCAVCIKPTMQQSVTVPRFFSGTGTGTFFRDLFFPAPVPVLFSGTKFFRYRYRYFFPGPIFSGTGTGTIQKKGEFPGPGQNRYHMGLFKCLRY